MLLPEHSPQLPLPTRRWLTPDEAAAYLGISRGHLDGIVREGRIVPSRTLGKRVPRYDVVGLEGEKRDKYIKSIKCLRFL